MVHLKDYKTFEGLDLYNHFKKYSKDLLSLIMSSIAIYKDIIPTISTKYYGKSVKSDGFRHMLAAAFFTTKIGPYLTNAGGEMNEFLGALHAWFKGEGFDSGWDMDTRNNQLGIKIGQQNPNASIQELSEIVKRYIDSGNFYTKAGILFKNDPNPQF
jgi:hypothetical protein